MAASDFLHRLQRVGTRTSPLRVHRRKAAVGLSLSESSPSSLSAADPFQPVSFLHSRRSAKLNFCETEFCEVAVGDLTLPATKRHGGFNNLAIANGR